MHILQTNLLGKGYSLLEVLMTYKEQYHAEFSFRDLQGPMAVSLVFLHTPERIQVLLFLIVVALMNLCPAGPPDATGLSRNRSLGLASGHCPAGGGSIPFSGLG